MNYKSIVFVSFENHFAPCGGLAAVMRMLPSAMAKFKKTILITPFFSNIPKSKQAYEDGIIQNTGLTGKVLYKGFNHKIEILKTTSNQYGQDSSFDIYFIKSEKFFLAGSNPYIDTWRIDALFHDSYFLSKSVPVVLNLIKDTVEPPYIINLQDWETALTVETMSYALPNKCVLTIHNPYDNKLEGDPEGRTILQYTIPKMAGLSTVSEHYAYELTNDVLQSKCFAWKLQGQFKHIQPIGINNGNFVNLGFPEELKTTKEILMEKRRNREIFNNLLHSRDDIKPLWGKSINLMEDDTPLYLIFGRDEPKQKGFDAAAASIYRLLQNRGPKIGYFIFTPIPGVYGLDSISYLEELCIEFGDSVMVFPFRLSAGYMELQKAANYIIMPSYYEPFGAATEGYAGGVPVIARATGGLIQQVYPRNYENLPKSIKNFIDLYHGSNNESIKRTTGFLYREDPSTDTAGNWSYLLGTDFSVKRPIKEPIDWRNPIFWSMVWELEKVLGEASDFYRLNKDEYCRMVLNGIQLFKEFTWEKSAKRYLELLYGIK